jgi:DNA-binding NarL/FixJ family response regulator
LTELEIMDILIIEDNKMTSVHLEHIIAQIGGHNVIGVADSALAAREILQSNKIALVFLEINLEGEVDGIEYSQELTNQGIPFVYISANSDQDILDKAIQTKPLGFVKKPYRTLEVLSAIEVAQNDLAKG